MKIYSLLIFIFLVQISWGQVGIGVPNPTESLEVVGSIKMVDGNQSDGKVLVSDANGKAEWKELNDGLKTVIINNINQGTGEVLVWNHPDNIEVRFKITNPNNDMVIVENKSTDATNYWNVMITGGATGKGTLENVNYKANFIRDDGIDDIFSFDLGTNLTGWFKIICTNQNNAKDGFIMNIMFYDDDINGIVQYWDEP